MKGFWGGCIVLAAVLLMMPMQTLARSDKADVKTLFLEDLQATRQKIVSLAEATPEDKYGWRPGPGVRSVAEVYLHVAGGNFMFPKSWGVPPPPGMNWSGNQPTPSKAKIIQLLNQSFDFMQKAVERISDKDLDKDRTFFGDREPLSAILFHISNHMHEHLGQSIAYARMNGIVPPWTAAEQKQSNKPK